MSSNLTRFPAPSTHSTHIVPLPTTCHFRKTLQSACVRYSLTGTIPAFQPESSRSPPANICLCPLRRLVDVHLKFKLVPETLYITVNYIDRFLAKTLEPVRRNTLQLVRHRLLSNLLLAVAPLHPLTHSFSPYAHPRRNRPRVSRRNRTFTLRMTQRVEMCRARPSVRALWTACASMASRSTTICHASLAMLRQVPVSTRPVTFASTPLRSWRDNFFNHTQ